MKAKFESSLVSVKREIEIFSNDISELSKQIIEIEKAEKQLAELKSLYENIL